jgi:hypothetical protein
LDNVYAFNRGDLYVGLTNKNDAINLNTGAPWANGTEVCNIFNTSDCQTIHNSQFNLVLNNGETKIFLPKTSSFFTESAEPTFVQA